jgi:hypothetical protein
MAGTRTWADGDVPSAGDFNGYLRDQVVTICTSGTRPTTSQDSRPIAENDTRRDMHWNASTSSWEHGLWRGAWATWTPALAQSAAITATSDSTYTRSGRNVTARFTLTATSAGTAGNYVTITLPVAAATPASIVHAGDFTIIDAGTALLCGTLVLVSSTVARFVISGSIDYAGVSPAYTIAINDVISGVLKYEAAAG